MTTAQTQGQTLPYRTMMMTTKSPLSPVNHLHHCSGQVKVPVARARLPGRSSLFYL